MKRILIGLFCLLCNYSLVFSAVLNTCNGKITNNNDSPGSIAYLIWATEPNGDVSIRIVGHNGDAMTAFRGNGMQHNGFYYTSLPANKSFMLTDSMNITINTEKTEIRLVPKANFKPKQGDLIRFMNKNIEWKTAQESNAYKGSYAISYYYGDQCAQLAIPSIISIAEDGTIQFNPVEYADGYLVYIYQGNVLMDTKSVTNGSVIPFSSYNPTTYSVRLQALGWSSSYTNSELSDPVDWTPAPEPLPLSDLCGVPIGSGNTAATLSWQTNQKGEIIITIDGDDGTYFRGANGMANAELSEFSVGNSPASAYFTRMYEGDNSKSFTLIPRTDATLPYGSKIRYGGTIAWKTAQNTNAYGSYSMEYIYGTVCPTLDTPVIKEITDQRAILFDKIENATSYVVNIYRDELLVYNQTVAPMDILKFYPITTDTYAVYLTAKSPAYQPATSVEPYLWYVEGTGEDLNQSAVCDKTVSTEHGGIYLSVETDEEGNILCTLSGPNNPTWRGQGLRIESLTIQGNSLQNYFDKQDGFLHTPTIVLLPKLGSPNIQGGDVIKYNGNVEWYVTVEGEESSPWISNFSFEYVYGTTCGIILPRLETPTIVSIDEKGLIDYLEVENAHAYVAHFYDEDWVYIDKQTIDKNTSIQKTTAVIPGFTYLVKLQAWPIVGSTEYRESKLSSAVEWYFPMLTGIEQTIQDDYLYRLYTIEGYLLRDQCTKEDIQNMDLHGLFILQHPTQTQIILLP